MNSLSPIPACDCLAIQPGRTWSVWDMLEINGPLFVGVVAQMTRYETTIEIRRKQGEDVNVSMADDLRKIFSAQMQSLLIDLKTLDALVTHAAATELDRHLLTDRNFTFGELHFKLREMKNTLLRELDLRKLFVLDTRRSIYYAPAGKLIADAVLQRFPQLLDDIEGAGHCVATGEGTAAVMHLMRVMEVGLKALSNCNLLGIPYAPTWESYLAQIQTKIGEQYKLKSSDWLAHEKFFRDASGDLLTVKQAWRNPSMHIERKYSAEEAEDIFKAVRRFMERLAVELPA